MPPNKKHKHKDKDNVRTIETPSAFGSHTSMIVDISEYNHNVPKDKIICQDERGYYVTYKNRIDNGLSDPCRYACPLCRFSNLNIIFSSWDILKK